jgi:hypothetical protein
MYHRVQNVVKTVSPDGLRKQYHRRLELWVRLIQRKSRLPSARSVPCLSYRFAGRPGAGPRLSLLAAGSSASEPLTDAARDDNIAERARDRQDDQRRKLIAPGELVDVRAEHDGDGGQGREHGGTASGRPSSAPESLVLRRGLRQERTNNEPSVPVAVITASSGPGVCPPSSWMSTLTLVGLP